MKIKKPRNSNSSHLIRTHACGVLAASQRARARTRRHLGHLQNENKKTTKFKFVPPHNTQTHVRRPGRFATGTRSSWTTSRPSAKMKIKHKRVKSVPPHQHAHSLRVCRARRECSMLVGQNLTLFVLYFHFCRWPRY